MVLLRRSVRKSHFIHGKYEKFTMVRALKWLHFPSKCFKSSATRIADYGKNAQVCADFPSIKTSRKTNFCNHFK